MTWCDQVHAEVVGDVAVVGHVPDDEVGALAGLQAAERRPPSAGPSAWALLMVAATRASAGVIFMARAGQGDHQGQVLAEAGAGVAVGGQGHRHAGGDQVARRGDNGPGPARCPAAARPPRPPRPARRSRPGRGPAGGRRRARPVRRPARPRRSARTRWRAGAPARPRSAAASSMRRACSAVNAPASQNTSHDSARPGGDHGGQRLVNQQAT